MASCPGHSFRASYDKTTKVMTGLVGVLLLLPVLLAHSTLVAFFAALVFVAAFAWSPRWYAVAERSIVVHRLIGNLRIPLEDVREIGVAASQDLSGAVRLWGNGGVFGYYGLFSTSKLGRCWWYVTNRKNAVVLITGRKTALFSPDDVDGFVAAVRAAVPVSAPAAGAPGHSPESSVSTIAGFVGLGVAMVVLAIVVFAFTYSPGAPGFTLTPASLTIHDRFYPVTVDAATVDAAHIRVVDLRTERAWRPTEKSNGFANAHYRSGWFRVANGQKVRMYQADAQRLVLLPPKGNGAAVLLEVKEPDQFVEQVRQAWAGQ